MDRFRKVDDLCLLGPQPTAAEFKQAQQSGVRTVIDLRQPGEAPESNAQLAAQAGLAYVNVPVNKAALTLDVLEQFEHALEGHPGPYLLHCATGARAAVLLALSRARSEGWNVEQTSDWARALGTDPAASPEFSEFIRAVLSEKQA